MNTSLTVQEHADLGARLVWLHESLISLSADLSARYRVDAREYKLPGRVRGSISRLRCELDEVCCRNRLPNAIEYYYGRAACERADAYGLPVGWPRFPTGAYRGHKTGLTEGEGCSLKGALEHIEAEIMPLVRDVGRREKTSKKQCEDLMTVWSELSAMWGAK